MIIYFLQQTVLLRNEFRFSDGNSSYIWPKIKSCVFQATPAVPNFLPLTLMFLSTFRGFPRDFPGRPFCFPIFPM